MRLLIRWAFGALALYLTVFLAQFLQIGLALKAGFVAPFVAVLALTLVNAFIRPIIRLLALPLTCLTFGLFGLVINAFMFYLVGQFDLGLIVKDFWAGLFGSVVFSLISGILSTFISDDDKDGKD